MKEKKKKEEEEEISSIKNRNGLFDYKKLMRKIGFKERNLNSKLVKKHFFTYDLGDVLKNFKKSKTNLQRNKIQVSMIKNGLKGLTEEITKISEEKKIKKPNEIVDIVKNILEFNRQQQGQSLKY